MEHLTLEQMKKSAEDTVRRLFKDPGPHPTAILSTEPRPGVTRANMVVLPNMQGAAIRIALDAFCAEHHPYAGFLIYEAWAAPHVEAQGMRPDVMPRDDKDRHDIILIVVDHESGMAYGWADIQHAEDKARRTIGPIDWRSTTDVEGRLSFVVRRKATIGIEVGASMLVVDPVNDRAFIQKGGAPVDCPECGSGGYSLSDANRYERESGAGDPFQRYLDRLSPAFSRADRLAAITNGRCATCGAPPIKASA